MRGWRSLTPWACVALQSLAPAAEPAKPPALIVVSEGAARAGPKVASAIFLDADRYEVMATVQVGPDLESGGREGARSHAERAKALGDLTSRRADFLAVEWNMATGRFVRRAHPSWATRWVWPSPMPACILT